MQTKQKIPLHLRGARLQRYLQYYIIFVGLMALYSVALDIAGASNIIIVIILLGLTGGAVYSLFFNRKKRSEKQSAQLSAEATEARPDASSVELYDVYDGLLRRDMRMEAVFWCFLCALALLCAFLLYVSGATLLSVRIGLYGIAPFLFLTAAWQLIASLLPDYSGFAE